MVAFRVSLVCLGLLACAGEYLKTYQVVVLLAAGAQVVAVSFRRVVRVVLWRGTRVLLPPMRASHLCIAFSFRLY